MNNRNLAIKISKHPLLRKLSEDKKIPKSILARLIVEELLEQEQLSIPFEYEEDKGTEGNEASTEQDKKPQPEPEQAEPENSQEYKRITNVDQDDSRIQPFLEYVNRYKLGLEGYKLLDFTVLLMNLYYKAKENKLNEAEFRSMKKALEQNTQLANQKRFEELVEFKQVIQFLEKYSTVEEELWRNFIKTFQEENFPATFPSSEDVPPPPEEPSPEPPPTAEPGDTEKDKEETEDEKTEPEDEKTEPEAPESADSKDTERDEEEIEDEEKKTPEDTETDEEEEEKTDPLPEEIEEKKKQAYIDASTKFQNDFYDQEYRIDQANLIGAVINAISDIYDNPNKVRAFGRVPSEEQNLQENDETIQASEDEIRNLRIDFRSLLSRINTAKSELDKFEKAKTTGSVVTDNYKKQFLLILKRIQASIKTIHNSLQIIIGDKFSINEQVTKEDIIQQWKEVQDKYDKAVQSSASLRELMAGKEPSEKPEDIIQDTYSSLLDLATHFPSVNPFGSSEVKTKEDMNKYKDAFENAVGKVKTDLQNVLSLMKVGRSGKATLQSALNGLEDFSGSVQSIFGVPSQFAEIKVDNQTPAAEGKPTEVEVEGDLDSETKPKEVSEFDKAIDKLTSEQIAELINQELSHTIGGMMLDYLVKKGDISKAAEVLSSIKDDRLKTAIVIYIAQNKKEVDKDIYDDFKKGFIEFAKEQPVMNVFDPNDFGKMLSQYQKEDPGQHKDLMKAIEDEGKEFYESFVQRQKDSEITAEELEKEIEKVMATIDTKQEWEQLLKAQEIQDEKIIKTAGIIRDLFVEVFKSLSDEEDELEESVINKFMGRLSPDSEVIKRTFITRSTNYIKDLYTLKAEIDPPEKEEIKDKLTSKFEKLSEEDQKLIIDNYRKVLKPMSLKDMLTSVYQNEGFGELFNTGLSGSQIKEIIKQAKGVFEKESTPPAEGEPPEAEYKHTAVDADYDEESENGWDSTESTPPAEDENNLNINPYDVPSVEIPEDSVPPEDDYDDEEMSTGNPFDPILGKSQDDADERIKQKEKEETEVQKQKRRQEYKDETNIDFEDNEIEVLDGLLKALTYDRKINEDLEDNVYNMLRARGGELRQKIKDYIESLNEDQKNSLTSAIKKAKNSPLLAKYLTSRIRAMHKSGVRTTRPFQISRKIISDGYPRLIEGKFIKIETTSGQHVMRPIKFIEYLDYAKNNKPSYMFGFIDDLQKQNETSVTFEGATKAMFSQTTVSDFIDQEWTKKITLDLADAILTQKRPDSGPFECFSMEDPKKINQMFYVTGVHNNKLFDKSEIQFKMENGRPIIIINGKTINVYETPRLKDDNFYKFLELILKGRARNGIVSEIFKAGGKSFSSTGLTLHFVTDSSNNPYLKQNKPKKNKGYVRYNRRTNEQLLTNKLKPLIREMLNKGK